MQNYARNSIPALCHHHLYYAESCPHYIAMDSDSEMELAVLEGEYIDYMPPDLPNIVTLQPERTRV